MKIYTILLLLCFQISFATDPVKIELPEKARVEGTYSFTVEENKSMHLIIAKDRGNKQYIVKPVLVFPDRSIQYFEMIELELLPRIMAHHTYQEKIIITGHNYKEKELVIIELNTKDGSHQTRMVRNQKSPDFVLSSKNESYLVKRPGSSKRLFVQRIRNSEDEEQIQIDIPKTKRSRFKHIYDLWGTEINQNEYVSKGSVIENKVYVDGNNLIFTERTTVASSVDCMIVKLDDEPALIFKNQRGSGIYKPKDFNSYYLDGMMFTVASNKEDLVFSTYKMEMQQELARISLKNDLSQKYDNIPEFLKWLAKGKISPTLTVNPTTDGNYLVDINLVDNREYFYRYYDFCPMWMTNDFFWQQHNQHVQDVINNLPPPPRFKPSLEMYENMDALYTNGKEFETLQFVVDKNGNLLKEGSMETIEAFVDKDKFIDQFEDDKKKLHLSYSFTDTTMSYIYQDKKSKDVFVSFQSILE